jgi:hypothetical protein
MANLGLDFKPPKHGDTKAWKALAGMYRAGHEWRTCGCNGPGWIPTSTSEFQQYLAARKATYEKQLRYTQDALDMSPDAKRAAVEFWAKRVQAVNREIETPVSCVE